MVGSDEISSLQSFTMDTISLCQDCGKLFTEKWMLQEHKRVAHAERDLKCDHCSIELIGLLKMKAHKQKTQAKRMQKVFLIGFYSFLTFPSSQMF
jgi:hypothetical protein